MEGGRLNKPQIYTILDGAQFIRGSLGTRVKYAPDVIGPRGIQKMPFRSYWWRLDDVTVPSRPKIQAIFEKAVQALAEFLDGRGML
jgi:hypothetical protein